MEKKTISWLHKGFIAFAALAVACCCVVLSGCTPAESDEDAVRNTVTEGCTPAESDEDAVRNTVTEELDLVKDCDINEADALLGLSSTFENYRIDELYPALLNGFDYEITDININEDADKATVTTTLTLKDWNKYTEAYTEALNAGEIEETSNEELSGEEYIDQTIPLLSHMPTKQKEGVVFTCSKKNDVWFMDFSTDSILQEALFAIDE
jgi:hypothetical protein